MKRTCCVAILLCLVLGFGLPIPSAAAAEETQSYVVLLLPGADAGTLQPLPYAEGYYLADSLDEVRPLLRAGLVEDYYPDGTVTLFDEGEADPDLDQQWYLDALGISSAWEAGYEGEGVTVAVIDSGIRWDHEDFAGGAILGRNFLGEEETRDETAYWDDIGHGTLVSGILAARRNNGLGGAGLTNGVTLLALRCFSSVSGSASAGNGSISTVISAIGYAMEQGADVINLSFGSTGENVLAMEPILQEAAEAGILLVASVGNTGGSSLYYPAAFDCVTGVGWHDRAGAVAPQSQHNESVYVVAPGSDILGPSWRGANLYRSDSGTSFASPMVSALAAIAKQADPGIETEEFRTLLQLSSRDGGEPGWDAYYGYGAVDAAAFVRRLEDLTFTLPFTDVTETDWYYDAVADAYKASLVKGVSDTLFDPGGEVTRAMVVTILHRLAGEPEAPIGSAFSDVPEGTWYTDAVQWAFSEGIALGYGDGTFSPEKSVTRQEMAAFFARYAAFCGLDTESTASLDRFGDAETVADWATGSLAWAVDRGLILGTDRNLLLPEETAQRCQLAAVLVRFQALL